MRASMIKEEEKRLRTTLRTVSDSLEQQYATKIEVAEKEAAVKIEVAEKEAAVAKERAATLERNEIQRKKVAKEQQKLIEEQKKKAGLYTLKPGDEIKQGTLGKAAGNVQKAIVAAYIDAIMKTATIRELQKAVENIPGIGLLTMFVSHFKCSNGPLISPPNL